MAKFNYDKDHPKVQNLKKVVNELREKKSKTFSGKILKKLGRMKKMTDEDAKNFADKLETRASKLKTATEGSFKNGGMLSPKQKKIAAKAPPRNKIDGKDFAVLKAEKAKGRGMGLQDEKMKPGKVMKAKEGKSILGEANKPPKIKLTGLKSVLGGKGGPAGRNAETYKKYLEGLKSATAKKSMKKIGSKVITQAAKAAKATRIGKIAAGVAGVALLAKAGLEKMYEKRTGKRPPTKFPKKKMGGGMMMRPRPMGYDQGDLASAENVYKKIKAKERKKAAREALERMEERRKKRKKDPRDPIGPGPLGSIPGGLGGRGMKPPRTGGGISNVPGRLGRPPARVSPRLAVPQMSTGSSVTVKVKLGRNKPTKLY